MYNVSTRDVRPETAYREDHAIIASVQQYLSGRETVYDDIGLGIGRSVICICNGKILAVGLCPTEGVGATRDTAGITDLVETTTTITICESVGIRS